MKRIAIFAHFDKDDIIDDYVIYYLQGLKKVADDIIFVSDCNLPLAETKKLNGICLKIIAQKHGEYDFGSYKRGILEAKNILNSYDELIIANDSCYGPIFPFENVFKQMEKRKCDFWGLTSSKEDNRFYYVGSYFLVFKKNVFLSDVFQNFFLNIKRLEEKDKIIAEYEVGLSRTLIKAGFKKDCFTKNFRSMPLVNSNAFDLFYSGFPLLKIAFLRDNPLGEGKVYRWKNYCSLKFIAMVENHLQRVIGTNNPAIWYYKLPYLNFFILHRKFIRIVVKKGVLRVKIFGITIIKYSS